MNWGKVLIAGIIGGVALNIADFIMHGLIMASAYAKYPIFEVEPANPLHFTLVALFLGLASATLFARTRSSWKAGLSGGATFGFFLGLVAFFPPFYNSLVFTGFPYYMSWCWGGINLIGFVVLGSVIGLVYRER